MPYVHWVYNSLLFLFANLLLSRPFHFTLCLTATQYTLVQYVYLPHYCLQLVCPDSPARFIAYVKFPDRHDPICRHFTGGYLNNHVSVPTCAMLKFHYYYIPPFYFPFSDILVGLVLVYIACSSLS